MLNKLILGGRLTADTELRYTPSGKAVANFTLAVDSNFKKADGEKETAFIKHTIWNDQAEFAANNCKKGKRVLTTGRVKTGYFDNKEGVKIPTFEMIVEKLQVIDWPEKADKGTEIPDWTNGEEVPF